MWARGDASEAGIQRQDRGMMGAGKEPTTSLACYLQDCIGNVMALKSMRRNPKCLIQR